MKTISSSSCFSEHTLIYKSKNKNKNNKGEN